MSEEEKKEEIVFVSKTEIENKIKQEQLKKARETAKIYANKHREEINARQREIYNKKKNDPNFMDSNRKAVRNWVNNNKEQNRENAKKYNKQRKEGYDLLLTAYTCGYIQAPEWFIEQIKILFNKT